MYIGYPPSQRRHPCFKCGTLVYLTTYCIGLCRCVLLKYIQIWDQSLFKSTPSHNVCTFWKSDTFNYWNVTSCSTYHLGIGYPPSQKSTFVLNLELWYKYTCRYMQVCAVCAHIKTTYYGTHGSSNLPLTMKVCLFSWKDIGMFIPLVTIPFVHRVPSFTKRHLRFKVWSSGIPSIPNCTCRPLQVCAHTCINTILWDPSLFKFTVVGILHAYTGHFNPVWLKAEPNQFDLQNATSIKCSKFDHHKSDLWNATCIFNWSFLDPA